MSLVCARVSCDGPAAASVQFNADRAQVVIVDLTDRTAGIPLCHAHTRTRTPPVGWTLVDSRTGARQAVMLDTPPDTRPGVEASTRDASGLVGPGSRPSVRRPADRGFVWERLGDEPVEPAEIREPIELIEEPLRTRPAAERPSKSDQHTPERPTSPLLSRAFRAAHSDHVD